MLVQFFHRNKETGVTVLISQTDIEEGSYGNIQINEHMNLIGPKNPLPDPETWEWFASVAGEMDPTEINKHGSVASIENNVKRETEPFVFPPEGGYQHE